MHNDKFIDCSRCGKRMVINSEHLCYSLGSKEIHTIEKKPVCHKCWDDECKRNVEIAESQFL